MIGQIVGQIVAIGCGLFGAACLAIGVGSALQRRRRGFKVRR